MKLALVSPLPPLASPAADLAARLGAELRQGHELRILPHAPEQVDGAFVQAFDIRPQADLGALMDDGDVELPIYLVADNDHHAAQIRVARQRPGLVVFLDPGIHQTVARITEASEGMDEYRDLLAEEYGATARAWPERYIWRPDRERVHRRLPLDGLLARTSLGVVAPPDHARRLRKRHPDVPIFDLPALDDPQAIAAALTAAAAEVREAPRPLPPPPAEDLPSVEVVIVGYNCRRIIAPALESIAAQDYPNLRCTLVDNASSDGTGDFVRENFPNVHVIASPRNLGFAGGNNVVMEHSDAKYVVLFNQDAIARRDFVRELVRVAERDDRIAAVGGKMLMLRCPTIFNSTGIILNEGGFAVDRQIGEKDEDPSPVPANVFGACGGAKLLRSSTIREVGGFDETFFMYCEDVDLCWRMRLRGFRVLYAPLAVVHHDWFGDLDDEQETDEPSESELNEKTLRRRSLCERNRLQCVLKNLEFRHLVKVLRRLRRYDRSRIARVEEAIARGVDTGYFRMVGKAIRSAWTWNLVRALSLFWRRRAIQRTRTVSDEEMAEYVAEGVTEHDHIGDLQIIHDRHCARAAPHLIMGKNDQKALGPGWYGVEPVPDQPFDLRWNKGRSWAYVKAEHRATRLGVRVARGPLEVQLRITLGTQALEPRAVEGGGMHLLEFELPVPQDPQDLVEVRVESETFKPSDFNDVPDHRILGVQIAEIWLE